ncbi:MAG: AZOBR_p60025 family cell surface glycopolymer formation protein [Microcystaceae cyanobacterium]
MVVKSFKKMEIKPLSLVQYSLIATGIVSVITLFLYFAKFSGNITGFFRIGSELPLSPYLDPETTAIFQGELGYDGQQFLSLALDPFLNNAETINSLDHPSYRYRRIFYPLISYILGLGNPSLIPYVMVGINLVSIILLVAVVGQYLKRVNLPKWPCLYVLFVPGVWMVLSLTTADLLSSLLGIAAIYYFRQEKIPLSALCLGIGCLTRETIILVWLGIMGMTIFKRSRKEFIPILLSLIPTLIWNAYVVLLNLPGYTGVSANFGFPFLGIIGKFSSLFVELSGTKLFEAYMWLLILGVFAAILWIYWQYKPENRLLYWITLLYGGMFIFSSLAILNYYLDYSRVYIDVYFLLLLTVNKSKLPIKTAMM